MKMDLSFLNEEEQKAITVIFPNAVYGVNWGILEKDQDFLNTDTLTELRDGYLVEVSRAKVIQVIEKFKEKLPKKIIMLFSTNNQAALSRLMHDFFKFKGGRIGIYALNNSPIAFYKDEAIPNYSVDFNSLCIIMRKFGFSFVLSGKVIPISALSSDEKVKSFLKTCELSGSGDSVVLEIVKDE